jgi:hypothetical protein
MPFPVTLVDVPKKGETGHAPSVQTMMMTMTLPPLRIDAKAILKKNIVGCYDGEKIYPLIKAALKEGRKVQLSVKGLVLSGWFFDTAVCKLYGDFDAETVDNNVEVVDIEEVDGITYRDMKKVRKLYYYDRPAFDRRMSLVDPDLDGTKDIPDYYDVGDDIFAPGGFKLISDGSDDEDGDINWEDK